MTEFWCDWLLFAPEINGIYFERNNYYLIRIQYYLILDNYHPSRDACTGTANWARIMELNDFQFWAEWWSSTVPVDTHISANFAPALFKRSANWPRLHDLFGVTYFFVARAQQNYSAPPTTTSCFWRSFPTSAEMTDLMVSSSFLPAALQIYVVLQSNQSLFFKRQNESMKLHFMEVKWQHL